MRKDWISRIQFIGDFFANQTLQKWMIVVGCALVLAGTFAPTFRLSTKEYAVGDIAQRDIQAARELIVEDEASTQKRRQDASEAVPSVYDFDPNVLGEMETTVAEVSALLDELWHSGDLQLESKAEKRRLIEEKLAQRFTPSQWKILQREPIPSFAKSVMDLVRPLLTSELLSERRSIEQDQKRGMTIRNIVTAHYQKGRDARS
jgi:membrane-associated HD superfamily phosphohydrolase